MIGEITLERRYFKNNSEWHYMLDQIGLGKLVTRTDGESEEVTDVESVVMHADIDIKWIDKGE